MIALSSINKTQLGPLRPTKKSCDWSLKNDFPRTVHRVMNLMMDKRTKSQPLSLLLMEESCRVKILTILFYNLSLICIQQCTEKMNNNKRFKFQSVFKLR